VKAVILAGGFGTRLAEETVVKPKPMVEVGGQPILWHVMKIYGHHGTSDFVICLGYKSEVIRHYFLHFHHLPEDLTVHLGTGEVQLLSARGEDWRVTLIDTGLQTQTGGRLRRVRDAAGPGPCLMTYGDGVADIDVGDLVTFHRRQGRLATVTAVRPPARFGALEVEGDRVARFREKPQAGEGWVNGGFFVLEPGAFDYIDGDATIWERGPMERLAADGQLAAYRHEGFWQCLDTVRDLNTLNQLWASGKAPWKVWE